VARNRYGVTEHAPVLGVLGGSLGARVLNQAVPHIVGTAAVGSVVHLTGRASHDELNAIATHSKRSWVTIPFEPEMEFFYAACDLVVCRAGAMTVSELAATGTPAILVPLTRVGQQWNAHSLAAAGGAVIVEEGDVGALPGRIGSVLADEHGLAAMSRAASGEGRPEAATVIGERLLEVADA
jgi:UDP-N-acetylglucosamine--N-acetylmuramyl-(pentapeptide) pyrophosphoryl-undecaprenol N-acetylglucosamine transferase